MTKIEFGQKIKSNLVGTKLATSLLVGFTVKLTLNVNFNFLTANSSFIGLAVKT